MMMMMIVVVEEAEEFGGGWRRGGNRCDFWKKEHHLGSKTMVMQPTSAVPIETLPIDAADV
jgi:hypothetical protein